MNEEMPWESLFPSLPGISLITHKVATFFGMAVLASHFLHCN
jgi:hypothetical protein